MKISARPRDEALRLKTLERYALLDTLPEQALDDLTTLAAEICGAPISLISLIDQERQWFKSKFGLSIYETDRDSSFCGHTILQREMFLVPDATQDERFADNPLVLGAPHVCFYAGVPLISKEGQAIGTFCVIDRVSRQLTPSQQNAMFVLSRQVMAQLELRRQTSELAASESRLRLALEAAHMGTFDWHVPGGRLTWSKGHEELWGFMPGEFAGTYAEFADRVHPSDALRVESELARCMASRAPYKGEFRVVWPDESVHWIEARGEFTFDEHGQPERMRGAVVETSAAKQIEARLRLSHDRFQIVARATTDAVWDWNLDSDALWWNENYQALFGYLPEETKPTIESWTEYIHPADADRVLRGIHAAIDSGGHAWSDEYRFLCRDGTYAEVFDRGYIIRGAQGKAERMIGAMQDITARKRAEANARTLAQRLILATDAAAIGVWDWDLRTDEWYASSTYFTMLGYDPNEGFLDRKVWFDRLHPDDRPSISAKITSVLAGDADVYRYEARMRHADGSYRWVSVVGRVLEADNQGKPSRLLGVRLDSTERKQAELRVQQLNRVYAVLSGINQTIVREKSLDAILTAACRVAVEKGRFVMAWIGLVEASSTRLRIAAHCGAAEDTLQIVTSLLEVEDGGCRCAFTRQALATGVHSLCNEIASDALAAGWRDEALSRGYRAMASLPLKVGEKVIGTFNLYAGEQGFFDAEEVRLLNELATDIAFALHVHDRELERRRVELALVESEARFRQLAESVNEVFWLTEPATGQVLYVSPAYETIWARSCASLYESPRSWLASIHAEDRERILAAISSKQSLGTYDEEYRVVRPDGGVRWVRDRAFPVRDATGEVERIAGVAQDVTARHEAETEMRRRDEEFRSLIENSSDIIMVVNGDGIIRFQSPSAERLLGYTFAEMMGRDALQFVHPEDVERAARALRAGPAAQAAPFSVEYRYRHKDGTFRILQSMGREIANKAGDQLLVINSRDVTEHRALEEQLRQSQKMEAIGQLAGGVAHDFNNILTVIHGYASLLTLTESMAEESTEAVQQIIQASERAAQLTRQLLAFGRRQVIQRKHLDLNEVVRGLTQMLRRIVAEDVHLQLDLYPHALPARADAGMLDQVLMNLVVNASDAMPAGGLLLVETMQARLSESDARAVADARAGVYACVRVTDTGSGISAENLARIFEPFFTTKELGKGTGLGLATVFGIVKQHGGFLKLDSKLGQGTKVEVFLPASEASQSAEAVASQPDARGGTETILLVEDESAVRNLTRAVLERAGYRVFEACNGVEALRIWERHRTAVSLLLTDLVMPGGVSGRKLANRLRALDPKLAVIFTSGYSADVAGAELILRDGENFIQKPYSPQKVLETVRRSLDA